MRPARTAGLIVLGLAVFAGAGVLASRPLGYDFAAYWLAGRHLLEGAPLYPSAGAVGGVYLGFAEFLYEPLVAVAFVPFAVLPFEVAAWLWTATLVAIATAVGLALVRPFAPASRPWAGAAYALYLPLIAEVTLGNLNLITVAIVLAAWHFRERPRIAGPLLAAAIGLKLLPIAMLLFYAGARRWRLVAWAIGSGALAIMVSLPFLAARWIEYLQLFAAVASESSEFAINVLPGAIAGSPLRFTLPILAAGIAVWAGARERRGHASAHHLALAAAPLVSPLIWYPYLVFVAPALWRVGSTRGWTRYAAVAAFALLELPSGRDPLPSAAFIGLLAVIALSATSVLRAGTPDARRSRPVDATSRRTASSPSGRSGTA